MANEFKIKHGFISTGDGLVEGEIAITGAGYADNGQRIATRNWATQYLSDNSYATTTDISNAIDALVASAPGTLDTLNELAAALGDDPNFSTTVTNSIATKLPLAGGTMSGNIRWTSTDRGLEWVMNTDGAGIKFYNTGDGDTNSRLEYYTTDNGTEYHRFMVATNEEMTIKSDGVRVTNNIYMASNLVATQSWVSTRGYGAASDITAVNTRIDEEVLPLFNDYAGAEHTHVIGDVTGLQAALDGKQPTGNYLTSYTETDTLDSVADRGATTNQILTVGGLKSTGDVGVGTTNPLARLHVSGGDGDVALLLEADVNNANESWNPLLHFKQDAGNINAYIGLNGEQDALWPGAPGNGMYINPDEELQIASSNVPIANFTTGQLEVLGIILANGGDSNNWNTAYSWGNHASAGYLTTESYTAHENTSNLSGVYGGNNNGVVIEDITVDANGHVTAVGTRDLDTRYDAIGAADDVNSRIDNEVLPSIPTNVSELTNDSGYITDGNTGWNNSYGFITSSSNISGTSAAVVKTVSGTNSAELVRGNMGDNDQARILVGASASNAGYLEIATADDGTEPIYVRQYTGVFSTLQRTATLLDGSGNTSFPGTVTAPTFSGALSGNATTASSAAKLTTARNIALSGAVTGSANFDGSGNITIAATATSDPKLTLAGDASGSATFTNLGNATLTVTVANDSHTHDGRYYTESESNARFVNVTGDTVTGDLAISGATLSVTSTAEGTEAFFVDGVNGRLFTISDDLSDSLFSANTISGLPVIEAFADNTVKLGPYSNPVVIDSTGSLTIGGATAATQSYVNTSISNLIGGAPGALNTLNELAAAINDDASFASSLTSSLALKAPLASPALTGTPTAPTQATSNNSTRIATTAFVKAQGYVTTDTNYYLNGISRSGNVLTFSVNGATNQTYTFGSNAFTSYSNHVGLYDSVGSATAVNDRIDNEVLPIIATPAITSNGSTPSLNTGITAAEIRGLIGAQAAGSYLTTTGKAADSNLLDGLNPTSSATANSIVSRNGSGDTSVRILNITNELRFPAGGGITDPTITCTTDGDTGLNFDGSGGMSFTSNGTKQFDFSEITTAIGWGNHASAGYGGAADITAVNTRIDEEVLPLIQTPAITSNGTTPSLNSGITAAEIRTLIGAGTSSSNTNYYLNGITKSGSTLTFSVAGATNQTYTFGSNAFTSYGNHVGLYDATGSADAVNTRIDNEVLPSIQTPAITSNGSTPSLNSGITAGEIRSLIGAQAAGSYLTSYTETDTLASVTSRGNTTTGSISVNGNILLTGTATTTNQGRMIDFTGFDKEGTTDPSDRAYIKHTVSTGGHAGSVLVISSQNDSGDGIAFLTHASSKLKHNSNNIATESWVTSQGYVTSSGNTIIGTDSDINTSGSTIIDNIFVTDGVITSMGTRTLTAANLGIAKPATPIFVAANIVGETIEVVFEQSPTSGVDYYQVWSSVAGGAFGMITQIPTQDIAATMTAIDADFAISGAHEYRVYAVKNGIYSDPAEGGVTFNSPALDVTNLSVVNLNTAYYIQYNLPNSRFVDHIEIYMDAEASSGSISRSGATLVYSGNNSSYMYQIGATDLDKFHQFWIEVIES